VFFINETQVAQITTTLPAAALFATMMAARSAANSLTVNIGQIKWAFNLFADPLTPL
jgi:hypothetical protein